MKDADRTAEQLYRVSEFRTWLETNELFPTVPDSLVRPLLAHLRPVEHALLAVLYDARRLDRAAAIQNALMADRSRPTKPALDDWGLLRPKDAP